MTRGKNLTSLGELKDDKILIEVVREGEIRIQAQLSAATSADQRALTWTGFVLTLALAVGGGAITLGLSGQQPALAVDGMLLSGLLALSAYYASRSVRPAQFCMPGNEPENWLPTEWAPGKPRSLRQARIEQATCLNNQIADNKEVAARMARELNLSMSLAFTAIFVAGIFAFIFGTYSTLNSASDIAHHSKKDDPS